MERHKLVRKTTRHDFTFRMRKMNPDARKVPKRKPRRSNTATSTIITASSKTGRRTSPKATLPWLGPSHPWRKIMDEKTIREIPARNGKNPG
jgi:hypothetical protein